MNDHDLLTVWQVHQDQLTNLRQKIHSITERTVAILLVLSGWLIVSEGSLSITVLVGLTIVVAFVAGVSARMIYKNNEGYLKVARVIRRLNQILGLFKMKTDAGEDLYETGWQHYGQGRPLASSWYHIALVWIVALLAL